MKTIRKLCTPAYVYLVISVISIVVIMIQNAGNETKFCLGSYECQVGSTAVVFLAQAVYTIFWVFVLNSICKTGYNSVSWFLVLLPYILFFIALGMLVLGNTKEGLVAAKAKKEKEGSKHPSAPALAPQHAHDLAQH